MLGDIEAERRGGLLVPVHCSEWRKVRKMGATQHPPL